MISGRPLFSSEAYMGFVSFIFAAAAVSWGAAVLGFNPVANRLMQPDGPSDVRVFTLDYLSSLDGQILAGGALYGAVLICFYWIYAAFLTTSHIPRRPWMLPLDFVALSFMTGAASSWVDRKTFVILAGTTVILLTIRFGFAAWNEHSATIRWKQRIMSHIVIVYALLFGGFGLMLLGAYTPTRERPISESELFYYLYMGILGAMALGVVVTYWHASKITPYVLSPALIFDVLPASEYGTPLPRLVPDYGIARSDSLAKISSDVRQGETRFRSLLRLHSGKRTLAPHLSRVHSLRDVETQAFMSDTLAAPGDTRLHLHRSRF